MRSPRCLSLILLAFCGPVFGQSDAITVTVSRNANLTADEVYFAVAVAADPGATLDDVLKAAQGVGLSAENLMSVTLQQYGPSAGQTRLAYAFGFTVPMSKFKETNDKLAAVRRTMASEDPSMDLQVYGIGISPTDATRDQARLQLLSPLFSDARARADQLAKAAGVTLGSVVGVTEAWATTNGYAYLPYGGAIGPSTLNVPFTLTVRYAVK